YRSPPDAGPPRPPGNTPPPSPDTPSTPWVPGDGRPPGQGEPDVRGNDGPAAAHSATAAADEAMAVTPGTLPRAGERRGPAAPRSGPELPPTRPAAAARGGTIPPLVSSAATAVASLLPSAPLWGGSEVGPADPRASRTGVGGPPRVTGAPGTPDPGGP